MNQVRVEPPRNAASERGRLPLLHLVEDDGSTLLLLEDVARDAGWDVTGFTRLADFRAELRHTRPDLIVLDDDLPDGRGGDVARVLTDSERLRDVPVVVCTAAHPRRQAEITAWAPVISKPFDLAQFEELLGSASSNGREESERAAG